MTIVDRVDVEAHCLEAFDFAQSYANRKNGDPFIKQIENGGEIDVPLYFKTMRELSMRCDYLRYNRPNCTKIKMMSGPEFLENYISTWRFVYLEAERTAVILTYDYTVVKGMKWIEADLKAYFLWDMNRRLTALKEGLEKEVNFFEAMEQQLTG